MIKPFICMKLKGRSDLIPHRYYGELQIYPDMYDSIRGEIATVMRVTPQNNVMVDIGGYYYYSMEMFEPIITNEK